MANLNIRVTIGNQKYSQKQLDHIYYRRALHVLHEMQELGAQILDLNDKKLNSGDINYLSAPQARQVLLDNKLRLGNQGLEKLYQDRSKIADQKWKEIIRKSTGDYTQKVSRAHISVSGISVFKIGNLAKKAGSDPKVSLGANPDHFEITNDKTGQHGAETMGLYGEPTKMDLTMGNIKPPEPVSKTHPRRLIGDSRLASDHKVVNAYAMHQIRPRLHGIYILTAAYFPDAAPDELVWGHAIHLAIEFSNIFREIVKGKV